MPAITPAQLRRFDASQGPRKVGPNDGEYVVYADAGDFVFKPREQWHTFWNAGDEPCRILEIIVPGGFEHFFDELAAAQERPDFTQDDLVELAARLGHEFDFDSAPRLCEEHGLTFPG